MVTSPASRPVTGFVTGSASSIKNLAGASLAAHYRHDAFTPGTPPDIAIGTNLQGDPNRNIDQSTVSKRPHLVGQAWDFNPPVAAQSLVVGGLASPVLEAADTATILCVAEFTATGGAVLMDISLGLTVNTGLVLFASGGNVHARSLSAASGLLTASTTPDNALHVYRATLRSEEIAIVIDGVETVVAAAGNGGLLNNLDRISMGIAGNGTAQPLFGQIRETVVLQNPTETQITGVENFLIGRHM